MTTLSTNPAVLRRFGAAVPGTALPEDFRAWSAENTTDSMRLRAADPELFSVLDGTAPATLMAQVYEGSFSPVPPNAQEVAQAATNKRVAALMSQDELNLTESLELLHLSKRHYDQRKSRQPERSEELARAQAAGDAAVAAQLRTASKNHRY